MPKECLYRLPFTVTPGIRRRSAPMHRIVKNAWWCIDFEMPPGTPVRAARAGVVVWRRSQFAQTHSTWEAGRGRSNCISILHADGQESFYVHLAWRSIRPRIGQHVRTGEIIGLSGATGYATYPHLHFGVFDAEGRNIRICWRE